MTSTPTQQQLTRTRHLLTQARTLLASTDPMDATGLDLLVGDVRVVLRGTLRRQVTGLGEALDSAVPLMVTTYSVSVLVGYTHVLESHEYLRTRAYLVGDGAWPLDAMDDALLALYNKVRKGA